MAAKSLLLACKETTPIKQRFLDGFPQSHVARDPARLLAICLAIGIRQF
jgi:hypothetical protein